MHFFFFFAAASVVSVYSGTRTEDFSTALLFSNTDLHNSLICFKLTLIWKTVLCSTLFCVFAAYLHAN